MTATAERPPARPSLAPDARPPEVRAVLDGLLEHLLNGVAYCRMEYADGQPSDFLFLYTVSAPQTPFFPNSLRCEQMLDLEIPGQEGLEVFDGSRGRQCL